jgi:hypothetical protein
MHPRQNPLDSTNKYLYLYSTSDRFESWPRHWLSWLKCAWFLSVPRGKYRDGTSIWPRSLVSKSFEIHHCRIILPSDAVYSRYCDVILGLWCPYLPTSASELLEKFPRYLVRALSHWKSLLPAINTISKVGRKKLRDSKSTSETADTVEILVSMFYTKITLLY